MALFPPIADREIVAARGARTPLDPTRPYATFVERERSSAGELEDVAAIFLTNKECPFRCVFCDLWQKTLPDRVADGLVAGQLEWALANLPSTSSVKLYNAGSFFDPQAIPSGDLPRIAELLAGKHSAVVECHPLFVDDRCISFAKAIAPVKLEIAMGLETVDPQVLSRIKSSMTLDDFERAARFLTDNGIDIRAFILLGPPGHLGGARIDWAQRSIDYAFSLGVECCVVIPVRSGNGSVEALAAKNLYSRANLAELQSVVEYGIRSGRGRVFADLWDVENVAGCPRCSAARVAALEEMNLTQRPSASPDCSCTRVIE
ncbi:MAG: radical SAM protein [Deltaproteobacteria bacterium]|nr:radical SAM protein [Deltaproteobacteria bacterium]MBW2389943.1 radical SAM protein [Deltaproteobacteria bacterium]